jgi:hypothetical protein
MVTLSAHAADRGERGVGGAGAGKRVGGFERGGDELVERDALRPAQANVALDLAHRAPRAARTPRSIRGRRRRDRQWHLRQK